MKKKSPAKPSPKKSAIARLKPRNHLGKFTASELPPSAKVKPSSLTVSQPNLPSGIYRNPDEAYQVSPEEAYLMLTDAGILSSLHERIKATALLNWSIEPENDGDSYQQQACDALTDCLNSTPNLVSLFENLSWACWFGRAAAALDFAWDFSQGHQRFIIKDWFPVHGDSLLLGEDGQVGYRIGVAGEVRNPIICTEGRGELISEEDRECWIIHQWGRMAGEFRQPTQAGAIFGLGLRHWCYPTWYYKKRLEESQINGCEYYAVGGRLIFYYELNNPASQEAMKQAADANSNLSRLLLPRTAGGEHAEGVESLAPTGEGLEAFGTLIEYYDDKLRKLIAGQSLTQNAEPTGLGSSVADAHQDTFSRLIKSDAKLLAETISRDLLPVLQKYNKLGGFRPHFRFAVDEPDIMQTLAVAEKLAALGVELDKDELREKAGFSRPKSTDEVAE